jgi:predicted Zn-dependent peptidase
MVLAAAMIIGLGACEKNEQEARKFPRADSADRPPREQSELVSYRLDNGLTVFMQEDHSDPRVAVEAVYRAGFAQEPGGLVQISHITEHAAIFSATASYEAGESAEKLQKFGMVNAEAVGDFVHFDYIVLGDNLPDVLQIESEHLASVRFDAETLAEQAKKAAGEITNILNSERGTLTKFAFMALMQAVNHGQTVVPIEAANYQRTVDEVAKFHTERYRVDDMILSIVGNFSIEEAKPLVEKYFGAIEPSPAAPTYTPTISRNTAVQWDIDASVFFVVCPGPYADYKERVILTMFGSYLSGYLSRNPDLFDLTRATYASNQGYPVGDLPFFVFAQPAPYKSLADTRASVLRLLDEAIDGIDENMFLRIRGTMRSYVTTSLLAAEPNTHIDYHYVLGQHALNLALKHMVKDGRSDDEFVAFVDSITLDDMKATLSKYLDASNRIEVTITGK